LYGLCNQLGLIWFVSIKIKPAKEEIMKVRKLLAFSMMLFILTLSACAPAKSSDVVMEMTATADAMVEEPIQDTMMDQTATPDEMMEKPTEGAMMETTAEPDAMMDQTATPDMMMDETPTADAMMHDTPAPDAMMEAPAWFGASFTDVRTGDTFSIKDFAGKVVLVETMAVWCPTCKRQQGEIKALHELLGMPADLVSISLDIDPNEDSEYLKAYVEDNTFDWIYAVSPAEVSREIGNLYGDQFLNPPSAPILIVDRQGGVHPLPFGVKSAEDLKAEIEPFLKEGM
jgi:hypothetical protein